MADNQENTLASSQESLPLSQETFQYLWDELQSKPTLDAVVLDDSHFDNTVNPVNNSFPNEMIPLEPIGNVSAILLPKTVVTSSNNCAPSSLPGSASWPGHYNFNVSFSSQEKNTKGVTWTYSEMKDKLYVNKDVPCPINFSANSMTLDNLSVRVMALYRSPEHASEIVKRCVNHSLDDLEKKLFEAEHLVRCGSSMARYEQDEMTKRHSVVVPFEIPAIGQQYSTYIYRFTCFGSCAGGLNRRPIMLIFSLEKDGQVVGRRRLDVKICACPGRDRKAEEQQLLPKLEPQKPAKRKDSDMVSLADTLEFTKYIKVPAAKKVKQTSGRTYVVMADSQEQYDFLIQMRNFFDMCKSMNNLPPNLRNALALMRSKKSQDGDSN